MGAMIMKNLMTRRDFLGKLTAAVVLFAGGCSRLMIWPVSGSDKGTVRLVFYTDVHARTEWQTPAAMEMAVRAINRRKVDLVITGGDLITDGFDSSAKKVAPRWDAYMKMHRSITADVFPTLGNHDLVAANPQDGTPPAEDPRAIYRTHMGLDQTYYSFDAVGVHFVILDSIQITGDELHYRGFIRSEELEWLRQDLAYVSRGTPVVLVTHIPLLTSFYAATRGATFAAPRNRVIVNNQDVFEVVEGHNVILVLQGHLHVEELIKWRDTSFIAGGAVSGRWWRGPWYGTEEGFNIITLRGNHVEWEYIDYGWVARRP